MHDYHLLDLLHELLCKDKTDTFASFICLFAQGSLFPSPAPAQCDLSPLCPSRNRFPALTVHPSLDGNRMINENEPLLHSSETDHESTDLQECLEGENTPTTQLDLVFFLVAQLGTNSMTVYKIRTLMRETHI